MPFINGIGPGELIIILIIALIVVGPGKLPDVGAALGKSIREFRKAATDVKEATSLEATPASASPAPASSAPATAPSAAVSTTPAATISTAAEQATIAAAVAAPPTLEQPGTEPPVEQVIDAGPPPADGNVAAPEPAPEEQPTATA